VGSRLPVLFGGQRQLALENLALRQQFAVCTRAVTRPPLRRTDRLFWIGLARVWTGWRQSLGSKLSGRPTWGQHLAFAIDTAATGFFYSGTPWDKAVCKVLG